MKVIFYDKQKFTRVSVPNVGQLSKEHNGKYYEWPCEKDNGYTGKYKCSRFDIERIENEGVIFMPEQEKIEKVIKALKESIDFYKDRIYGDKCNVWLKASYDAIELLKAQEPIAPVKVNRYMETDENGDWFSPETYDCGNCGVELHGKADYCHLCGRAVKWK